MKLVDLIATRAIEARIAKARDQGYQPELNRDLITVKEFLANEMGLTYFAHKVTEPDNSDEESLFVDSEFRGFIIKKLVYLWEEGPDKNDWMRERYPHKCDLFKDAVNATNKNLLTMYEWAIENLTMYG